MSQHVICHDINYNWFHNTFYAYNQCNGQNFFKNIDININNIIITTITLTHNFYFLLLAILHHNH